MFSIFLTLLPVLALATAAPTSPSNNAVQKREVQYGRLKSGRSGRCLGSDGSDNGTTVVDCDSPKAYRVSVPRNQSGAVGLSGNVLVVDGELDNGSGVKVGVYDKYQPAKPNTQEWVFLCTGVMA